MRVPTAFLIRAAHVATCGTFSQGMLREGASKVCPIRTAEVSGTSTTCGVRWLSGQRALSLLMLVTIFLAACDRDLAVPTLDSRALDGPTPVTRGGPEADGTGSRFQVPTLERVSPSASVEISYTVSAVAFPADADLRPGRWSPAGDALLAYVGRPGQVGLWSGRLWIVDAISATPRWDSGDVEGSPANERMAACMADGSLAIARQDGPFVGSDGLPLAGVAGGLDGQLRQAWVDPTGQRVLFIGPGGAWLAQRGSAARFLSGWPAADLAGWSWSPDGRWLALGRPDGRFTVVDVSNGESERITGGHERVESGAMPAPRWLADGRVLLTVPREIRYLDGVEYEHRMIDPLDKRAESVSDAIGIARSPIAGQSLEHAVSPDGRYLLYPEYRLDPASGETVQRATWLYDLLSGSAEVLPPLVDARWSPASDRIAVIDGASVEVLSLAEGTVIDLAMPGTPIAHLHWSPQGRWLMARSADRKLWLAAADGSAGSRQIAEAVTADPSWAANERRFAVSISTATSEGRAAKAFGPSRLILVDVETVPR